MRILIKHFGDKLIRLQLYFSIRIYDDPKDNFFSVSVNCYGPRCGNKGMYAHKYPKTFPLEIICEEIISGFFQALKSENPKLIEVLDQYYVAEKSS